MPINNFLEIDYTRHGEYASTHDKELTDKVVAKGMSKYLKKYYTFDGKWDGIGINGTFLPKHDFFQIAQIKPIRFYEIFKETERIATFLDYFKEFNVKAELKHNTLTLIDLEYLKYRE